MEKRKFKLGILLDSYEVPLWVYNSLEGIANSNCAEFSLVILNESKDISESKFNKLWRNKDKIVYYVYDRIDERLFHRKPNAFRLKHLGEMLSDVSVMKVKPIQDRYSDCFEISDINRIKGYELDILIRIGFRILRGDILTASKYGVWSYHHGDNRINRGGPPGFWEVVENWPKTGATLYILGDDRNTNKVLSRSSFRTYSFSPFRNRSYIFWALSGLLPRQIELLYRLGEQRFLKQIERFNEGLDFYDGRQYETPSNILAVKLIGKLAARMTIELFQRAFYLPTWYLLFNLTQRDSVSFAAFDKIVPPKDRFWADPNVIQKDGSYWVFVEEYIYRDKKGQIAVIQIDPQIHVKDAVRVLERDYHLSYPFVFEFENRYFMVPESAENRTIDLYECVGFPNEWNFRMSLMKGVRAVDTTLFYYRQKWWLFTAMAENEGSFPQHFELFLFFSGELFSTKWEPHPLNPIVSDVKRARPAGRVFVRNRRILRPSQDCSQMYGYGIDLNEIIVLSESEYEEKRVASVRPCWDKKIKATHTFASEGDLTIIDAFTRRRKYL